MSSRAVYPGHDAAGFKYASRSAKGGGWVVVYVAAEQGMDVDGARYAVSCDSHGCLVGSQSLADAKLVAREPANFCDDCR